MGGPILALDEGTTSVRAMLVGEDGTPLARARREVPIVIPRPGYVEQDAALIYERALAVMTAALRDGRCDGATLGGLGITSQRGNIVVWNTTTGNPETPLVSWQDLRGTARAGELQAAGYLVSHQTPASKLEAVVDGLIDGRKRLESGALLWGNIDTYLLWRLSRGEVYAMDESQACTTGYYDHFGGGWNESLIALQGLAPDRFPKLVATFGRLGHWQHAGAPVPIGALIADQQSAALAEGCLSPGAGKVTYGTAAAANVHTGGSLRLTAGTYPLVLWRWNDARTYCLEGMMNTAGALLDWMADLLGVGTARDLGELALLARDTAGVHILPALQGLGSPHGDAQQRARIVGLSRASGRAEIARAAFAAIAMRVREIDAALYAAPDLPRADTLRADGGAAASDLLMQMQADLLGRPVARLGVIEATALGAALGTTVGLGARDLDSIAATRRIDRLFEPSISQDERDGRFEAWRTATG